MKILIAVDDSPSSNCVVSAALARPWPHDSVFTVLNVVIVQRFERLPVLIEDATREGLRIVQAAAEQFLHGGYHALGLALPGHPRKEISAYAKEWAADLVLIGSHGHGAVGRFLLGSVAQGVLRTAPCSVEIVRCRLPDGGRASKGSMKVLLATDGSPCSVEAANAAARQIWPQGSVFRVVSVEELMIVGNQTEASSLAAMYPTSQLELMEKLARDRAMSAAADANTILTKAGRKVVEASCPLGDPRSVIVEIANGWPADLVVLGSHGRRGLDRLLMGSVSESVAIHAACSVRVIRAPLFPGEVA